MTNTTLPARQRLRSHEFLHFERRQPLRLRADSGSLWVTQDGELDDIQLDAGTQRDFDGRARITVGTLGGDALVSVTPLAPAGWTARLRDSLDHWRHDLHRAVRA